MILQASINVSGDMSLSKLMVFAYCKLKAAVKAKVEVEVIFFS